MAERLKYITAVVLYGTIGMFLRQISLPTEMVAMARGAVGALMIVAWMRLRGERMDWGAVRRNLRWLLISGVSLGLNWIFLFAAYVRTTVAIASLCNYLAPALVVLTAPLILREPLNRRKLPCVFGALLGVALVSGILEGATGETAGVLLGLAAAVGFMVIVLCNRRLEGISSLDRAAVQLALSALTILPYVLWANRGAVIQPGLKDILLTLMICVVQTGFAYVLYFSGMATLPVQSVAVLGYLEPAVSVLCSALFLHERMTPAGWIGALLILASAVVSECIPERKG